MVEEFVDVGDKQVLDVGCGRGDMARLIADQGAREVFGVDFYEYLVYIAGKNVGMYGGRYENVHFERIRGLRLGYDNESFEKVIVSGELLSLLITKKMKKRFLREVKRVLKKGGKVALYAAKDEIKKEYLKDILEEIGFTNIKLVTIEEVEIITSQNGCLPLVDYMETLFRKIIIFFLELDSASKGSSSSDSFLILFIP